MKNRTLKKNIEFSKEASFPGTRYQGSKNKMVEWIYQCIKDLKFNSFLDAFGGTGCVGYKFKKDQKQIFYNDYLCFNYSIGKALIENNSTLLSYEDINFILGNHKTIKYPSFIADNFHNIYFTDEENTWLDQATTNISTFENEYKKALAYFALFQACLIKRPYNLFHRKNLYMRTNIVKRSFGNKKSWDTPFDLYFSKFAKEANDAIFDNNQKNIAFWGDISDWQYQKPDLVYIDTPYISHKGIGTNYYDFYHFLEGLTMYEKWPNLINHKTINKKIKNTPSRWSNKKQIHQAFSDLFLKFKDSTIVVSYRNDGIPTTLELTDMLKSLDKKIQIKQMDYKYALSSKFLKEILIIAM